jgi:hypothetical protein
MTLVTQAASIDPTAPTGVAPTPKPDTVIQH